MSSIISDSLDFKWDTEHLNCGTEEEHVRYVNQQQPQQVYYPPQQQVYYPPQQPVVVNQSTNSVVKLIKFIVVLVFIGLIAWFICGGNPDVLVSYINSCVTKLEFLTNNWR